MRGGRTLTWISSQYTPQSQTDLACFSAFHYHSLGLLLLLHVLQGISSLQQVLAIIMPAWLKGRAELLPGQLSLMALVAVF